ncbi:MAG: hypothetical protein P0119_14505 [Nitrospira sp.]|nr:hypothetical protein [Nitrospira sp.]
MVALAGAAEAASGAALVVDLTRGTKCEIAASDEQRIREGLICLAERLCLLLHHVDGIVAKDKGRRIVVVLKYWEPVRMASLMDDTTDQVAEFLPTIDVIVVANVNPIPHPIMGQTVEGLRVQAFARLPFRPFILADDIDARPFPDKLVAVVVAKMREFVCDSLKPPVDIVGSPYDIVLGTRIAFLDGIG